MTAGVASAQFQYSPAGAGTWNTINTDTTSPYSVTWDTTALTDGGSYDLRVITTDNASNTFTSATVTVTVDRTAPAPTSAKLANGGANAGKAETSDTATFTYSEQLNAASLCSVWTNAGNQTLNNATVTLTDNGVTDALSVTTASCAFNFGSDVVGDYVSATATFTNSTVTWNPAAKTLRSPSARSPRARSTRRSLPFWRRSTRP